MLNVRPLPCIACGAVLEAVFPETRQPYRGTSFFSEGHYGSTVFDPMDNSQSLTLNVCDDCLRAHNERVLLMTTERKTRQKYRPWSAP